MQDTNTKRREEYPPGELPPIDGPNRRTDG